MECKIYFKKCLLGLLLTSIILIILYNIRLSKTINGYSSGIVTNLSTISLLSPTNNLTQEFYVDENNFYAIDVLISTYNRKNNSNINFILKDDTKIILDKMINAISLHDNSYYRLNFKELISKNKKYKLFISSSNSDPENSVSFWKTDKENSRMKLYINNLYQKNNLRFIPYRKIKGFQYLNILFKRISLNNIFVINEVSLHVILFTLIFVISIININFIEVIYENITRNNRSK